MNAAIREDGVGGVPVASRTGSVSAVVLAVTVWACPRVGYDPRPFRARVPHRLVRAGNIL